jgi:acetyl-CoA acetyltransferase
VTDIAVVAFAQTRHTGEDSGFTEVELLAPMITAIKEQTGQRRFGFTCSGSLDYLAGAPFSFVSALDAVGAWPPISESHVEMDAAWALHEAYVRLRHGDVDTALVYGFGKPSQLQGRLRELMTLQLDPYYLAPLGVDQVSLAALQARAYLDRGHKEDDLRAVAARSRAAGRDNPYALDLPDPGDEPYEVAPLRPADCAAPADGAAAIVLATGDKARELCERPAWIRHIDHRIEAHSVGNRDLGRSESTALAAGSATGDVEVAELHAQFSHEELILREALGLGDDVRVNPSGGPLAANPVMATGLIRVGEAATWIHDGEAARTLAHASSGPCLQSNLVCVMEA